MKHPASFDVYLVKLHHRYLGYMYNVTNMKYPVSLDVSAVVIVD